MSLPADIARLLPPGAVVSAHAAVSSSPGSSIGETRLLVVNNGLMAFARESLIGDFAPLALDASFLPVLEGGDFSSTLRLRKADGSECRLAVSTFERSHVAALLAALAPARSAPQAVPETPQAIAAEPVVAIVAEPPPPMPATQPAPVVRKVPEPATPKDGKWRDEFAGDTPFLTGCLPTLLVAVGLCVGLWMGETALREYAWHETGWGFLDWSVVEFFGKAVAIIGGLVAAVYFGIWLDGLNFRVNTTGRVTIKNGLVIVLAPKSAWKADFALKRTHIEFLCRQHDTKGDASDDAQACEAVIRLTCDNRVVGLYVSTVAWKDVAGGHWQAETKLEKPEQSLTFLGMNFSPMHARLLRELHDNKLA